MKSATMNISICEGVTITYSKHTMDKADNVKGGVMSLSKGIAKVSGNYG
ncbi:MAG TPA: hypothetical protein VN258_07370 [Mobilitalea sp.]|nr:hypothetical protein [Mobilitalea sp.]